MSKPNTLFSYFKKTPSKSPATPKAGSTGSPCTPLQNKNHGISGSGKKKTASAKKPAGSLNNFSSPLSNKKIDAPAVGKENSSLKKKKRQSSDGGTQKKRRRIIESGWCCNTMAEAEICTTHCTLSWDNLTRHFFLSFMVLWVCNEPFRLVFLSSEKNDCSCN